MAYKPKVLPAYRPVVDHMVQMQNTPGVSFGDVQIGQMRAMVDLAPPSEDIPGVHTDEMTITVQDHDVKLYLLRPASSKDDILPCFIYVHGGGFVMNHFRHYQKLMKQLVVKTKMAILFLEYSLSPEVKFPTQFDECYETVLWAYKNAEALKINPEKLALGGDSGPGAMTASVCMKLKDNDYGHIIKAQVLIYAVMDFCSVTSFDSASEFGNGDYGMKRGHQNTFMEWYFEDAGNMPSADYRVAQVLASDEQLKNMPPTLAIAAEIDMNRDEALAYVQRLNDLGVPSTAVQLMGTIHAFLSFPIDSQQYRMTIGIIRAFLEDALL
ncbi:alpha/beta-hydrolase [Hesseltinella vesiculosa]|uniref:Alpha/beta-hydrolase n=1 Tax=Hesseltinella vesiculosa TaxID=101127 RepID=A0A1X2G8V2_9FUNG|nr:alpha/beta-hydrolase [Hesseltinella vesiculosa]